MNAIPETENAAATAWKPPVLEPLDPAGRIDLVLRRPDRPTQPQGQDPAFAPRPQRTDPQDIDGIREDESLGSIAGRHPKLVALLVTSILNDAADGAGYEPDALEFVAIMVAGLGPDRAGKVFQNCSDEHLRAVGTRLRELPAIPIARRDEVFAEARRRIVSGEFGVRGGTDVTRAFVGAARGPRRYKILSTIDGTDGKVFERLSELDPSLLTDAIRKEHPQTIAVILSRLEPVQAAAVLNRLSDRAADEVANRIARLTRINPEVMRRLEESLLVELDALASNDEDKLRGQSIMANILKEAGRSTERQALAALDARDPELAEEVRNHMFVFDDIASLTDREIQLVLEQVDSRDLAVSLKGASETCKERILSNHSEEDRKKLLEEMQFSGPVRMSDVENVQLRIVKAIRQSDAQGEIQTSPALNPNDKFV